MKEETTILELNDYEKRVLIEALNDRRNDLIESDRCPYDVSDLLSKWSTTSRISCSVLYGRSG